MTNNLILVFAIAANKSDLLETEQVKESEGRAFAKVKTSRFIKGNRFSFQMHKC